MDTAPLPPTRHPHIERLQQLATALDAQFRVPILGFRIGWDGIIGLIPGVGDIAGAVLGLFLISSAIRYGARKRVVGQMVFNLAFDAAIGLVPLLGDLADFANKAHAKNVRLIIHEYEAGRLERLPRHESRS